MTGSRPPTTRLAKPIHHTSLLPPVVPKLVIGNAANSSSSDRHSAFSFLSISSSLARKNQRNRSQAREHRHENCPGHGLAQNRALLALDAGDARAQHDVGWSDCVAIGTAGGLRGDDCLPG